MTTILLCVITVFLAYIATPFIIVTWWLLTGHPDLVAVTRTVLEALRQGGDE